MAIDPSSSFPTRTAPPDADFPFGAAVNESVEGADDGTPLVAPVVNDLWGFIQAVLTQSGQTPSGTPETAQASQVLEGLLSLAQSVQWLGTTPIDSDPITDIGTATVAVSRDTVVNLRTAVGAQDMVAVIRSGGSWAISGAATSITMPTGNDVAAIGTVSGLPRVVAVIAEPGATDARAQVYEYTRGVGFTAVGSNSLLGLAVNTTSVSSVGVGAGRFAVVTTSGHLAMCEFDGSDSAVVGNVYAHPSSLTVPKIACLTPDIVAVVSRGSRELQAFRHDGTDWAPLHDPIEITPSFGTSPNVVAINDTDVVVLVDVPTPGILQTYRLTASGWVKVGAVGRLIADPATGGLTALSGTRLVVSDPSNDNLDIHDLGFSFGPMNSPVGGAF